MFHGASGGVWRGIELQLLSVHDDPDITTEHSHLKKDNFSLSDQAARSTYIKHTGNVLRKLAEKNYNKVCQNS